MVLQAPPRVRTRTGALRWVVLAIILNVLAALPEDLADVSAVQWALAVGGTIAWFLAARNAKNGLARVILWLIVIGEAAFWLVVLLI